MAPVASVSSIAAATTVSDGVLMFEQQTTTVSYGAFAADLLTTLRRSPDAEPGDQVLVLTHSEQTTLEPTGTRDEEPGRERLSTVAPALRLDNLKIAASEHAADICRGALNLCGIVRIKNDTAFSVGRHLRDSIRTRSILQRAGRVSTRSVPGRTRGS